ncbi:RNA polymerase subunit sigma-70 [Paenibacillus protaetiae]|uniref:RNA polymerase subunit sigma-70 n=1 Tax=Paenibacillus protaetiae TaxID=2509456 RepID=A0A4P6EYF7_9BACL|nr:RNA polymerase subunit sigma-70 [Paenibacillus protaetiae]QAY67293.1 RNA polymerase subunit sigma-70 [Paenibacillus protaetiae]
MQKITEQDVVIYYTSLVTQECKAAYKGLELEDRIAEGTFAIIHAIRTYRTHHGSFKEYMLSQVKLILKQKNKEAWAMRKPESIISLDAPLTPHSVSATLNDVLRADPYDDTLFDVNCFTDQLSRMEKQVISLMLEDRNINKVATRLGIPILQVQDVLESIQSKYRAYL